MKNKIIYIGNFPYPVKSGVGNRVGQNVSLLQSLGYQVCVIATDNSVKEGSELQETKKEINGCDVYYLPSAKTLKQRVFYKRDLKQTRALLEEINRDKSIFAVFFTGTKFSMFAEGLLKFCKKNGIKTIADSMDWLTIHSRSFLFNFIKRFDIFWEMRVVNKKADGILAISTYLQEYYGKRGKPTIVIPPLFSKNIANEVDKPSEKMVRLIYAGTPFGPNVVCKKPEALKDRLDKAIEILYQIKKQGINNFLFDIYGVTESGYQTAFPQHAEYIKALQGNICFHGKAEYTVIEQALHHSDFTLLIRDDNRETRAGFPSKVGESISSGVPVIISDVGDHSKYIKNGCNGFLLSKDLEIAKSELTKIFKMERTEIDCLKMNCISDEQFIFQTYLDGMKKFLQDLKE